MNDDLRDEERPSTRKTLVRGRRMPKKTRHPEYARGYEKGYEEGKQVGFEKGRIKGREETLAQGDEAFIQKYEQERKEAYARGYAAGRSEKESLSFDRGYDKGRKAGILEGYKRFHDSLSGTNRARRPNRCRQRQPRPAAQLPFDWNDDE